MLSSYPVACPHATCNWNGNLIPSQLRGGPSAEIMSMHRAWFRCPHCQGDWEVRITDDRVTVLPIHPKGVASLLVHARAGDPRGRHTFDSDQAQSEDRWRDDGGQG